MLIADLHIHSKYSRATSRESVPEFLELWSRRKGIHLLGTGDFTHPAWRAELAEKLAPAEDGLYTLRDEFRLQDGTVRPEDKPRFAVTGEISSIYKKNGKVRKVHNVIILPGLEAAESLSRKLEAIGNIHSDGRPILGLDSRDLLEITLDSCPDAIFIPAHIWTPHFSLFGAFSGFDTIEECFEDLTPEIHALETGLSSDPPMNWRISALDSYTLVSHSDAHSPSKLGREANLLDIPYSYSALSDAIQGRNPDGFLGTIEFFPEEGKYHYDGHRNCGLCLKPSETANYGGKCPVCERKITIGVEHRVEELADRREGYVKPDAKPFESLIPLPEVIAASTGLSTGSSKVNLQYEAMLKKIGPEFYILREAPLEDIGRVAGPCIEEGIRRLRDGRVERTPGYDGEYGTIQLLDPAEIEAISGQTSLFGADVPSPKKSAPKKVLPKPAPAGHTETSGNSSKALSGGPLDQLNEEQLSAVTAQDAVISVIAGPGTGKTKTLVSRIAYLIEHCGIKPSEITAVTFTNKAAGEMRERLKQRLGGRAANTMTIGTFHSICLRLLSSAETPVLLADEFESLAFAEQVVQELELNLSPRNFLQEISKIKNSAGTTASDLSDDAYQRYCTLLQRAGKLDFDDLLLRALQNWEEPSRIPVREKRMFSHLLVDEFQDINAVQYRLVRSWSLAGKSLFVIGDPDQSIYGFRGATARCFELLFADVPGIRQIRLTKNYRSTPEILACALPVISHNTGEPRALDPQRKSGSPVNLLSAESDLSEAIYIAKEINRIVGGIDMLDAQSVLTRAEPSVPRDFSDIAILYRTHRQADILEKCLRKEGIPYLVTGRENSLADKKVRASISFFRFLLEPCDASALCCSLKGLWNCPADLLQALEAELRDAGAPLSPEKAVSLLGDFSDVPLLQPFLSLAAEFLPRIKKEKPHKLFESFAQEAGFPVKAPYEKLLNTAVFYKDLPAFLQALLLGEEGDLTRSSGRRYSSGAVSLMTLHGSKGLEFPVVFLCGIKKGTLPLESKKHPADPEEERRLFFVGMTRACEELYLMTSQEPSPFLSELPGGAAHASCVRPQREPSQGTQLSLF